MLPEKGVGKKRTLYPEKAFSYFFLCYVEIGLKKSCCFLKKEYNATKI